MQKKRGEQNYRGLCLDNCASAGSPFSRKLERVLMRLEPLSDQNAFLGFLRNVDNAKALTGFVQELANAVTDYQARATYRILV